MNDFDIFANSPSFDLTNHQHGPPIYSSTPLIAAEKPLPSSVSSSFCLPLTETTQNNEQLVKLNEDLCLLGLFDYVPKTANIDQTVSACRQLVKHYNKLSHDKHLLHEKLKSHEIEQTKFEKREDSTKHDIDCLQVTKERLADDIQRHTTQIHQLKQILQTKDREIRRLNQVFVQQSTIAKHQYRTLEKQMDKLKEKILQLEKNRSMTSTIDYSFPLFINESIVPPSSPSSSEVLLKKICHDYDQKHRLLMIENEQLRQCVVDVYQQFNRLLLIHRRPTDKIVETDDNEASFETKIMYLPCDAVNEIVRRYFSKIYDQLDRYMFYEKPSQEQALSDTKDDKLQTSLQDQFLPV